MTASPSRDWLVAVLREPALLRTLAPADWSLLVRQARRAGLLARLDLMVDEAGLAGAVPPQALPHLRSASMRAAAQHHETRREVEALRLALLRHGLPLVLLKGAAYLMRDLPANRGRSFSDVDILVPKARLNEAEESLMLAGWMTTHHSAYDQRYYRQWMHELPPMQHIQRESIVDVHHAIMPETARRKPDAARLLAAAREIPGHPGVLTLAPEDMALHSMTHLFHNDELSHGLRDLTDLRLLLQDFGRQPGFWPALAARAVEQDLVPPLYLALRCLQQVLGFEPPADVLQAARAAAPSRVVESWMDALWRRALGSQHPTVATSGTTLALFLLYVRAHWLRMPPLLLARHLSVKAWRRVWPEEPRSKPLEA